MKAIFFLIAMLIAGNTSAQTVLYSKPGETMDQFVMRIAPAIAKESRVGRYEVCGAIARLDSGYSLALTKGSAGRCSIPMPPNYAGQTFHTHFGDVASTYEFSDMDYAAGPGYMAHGSFLWHQEGVGTERKLAGPARVRTH